MPITLKVGQLGNLLNIRQVGPWRVVLPAGLELSKDQIRTISKHTGGFSPGDLIDPSLAVTGQPGRNILFLGAHQEIGPWQRILPPADLWLPVKGQDLPKTPDLPLLGLVPEYDYCLTVKNVLAAKKLMIKDWRDIDASLKKNRSSKTHQQVLSLPDLLIEIALQDNYQAKRVCQILAYKIENDQNEQAKEEWLGFTAAFYQSITHHAKASRDIREICGDFQIAFLFHYGRYKQALDVLEEWRPLVSQGNLYPEENMFFNLVSLDLLRFEINILLGHDQEASSLATEIESAIAIDPDSSFRHLLVRGIFSLLQARFYLNQDRPRQALEILLKTRTSILGLDYAEDRPWVKSLASPETDGLFDRIDHAYAGHRQKIDALLHRINRSIREQIQDLEKQIKDLRKKVPQQKIGPKKRLEIKPDSIEKFPLQKGSLENLNDELNLLLRDLESARSPEDYVEDLLNFSTLLDQNRHPNAPDLHQLTEDVLADYFTLLLLLKIDAFIIQKTPYCLSLDQKLSEGKAFISHLVLAVDAGLLKVNGQNSLVAEFSFRHGTNLALAGQLELAENCWRSAWLIDQSPAAAQKIIEARLKTARTPDDLKRLSLLISDKNNRTFKESLPDGLAAYGLAWVDKKLGKHREAAEAFQKIANHSDDPADRAQFSFMAGQSYLAGGDLSRAAKSLEDSLSLHQPDQNLSRFWQILFNQTGEVPLSGDSQIKELLDRVHQMQDERRRTAQLPFQTPTPPEIKTVRDQPVTVIVHEEIPRLSALLKIENGQHGEILGSIKNLLSQKLQSANQILASDRPIVLGKIANPYHLLARFGLVEIDLKDHDPASRSLSGCLVIQKSRTSFTIGDKGISLDMANFKEDPLLKPFYEILILNFFLKLQSPAEPWLEKQLPWLKGKLSRRDKFKKLVTYYPNAAERSFLEAVSLTQSGLTQAVLIDEKLGPLKQQQLAGIKDQVQLNQTCRGGEAAAGYEIMEKLGLKKIIWRPAAKAEPIKGSLVLADGQTINMAIDRQGNFSSDLPDPHLQPVWNLFLENYALAVWTALQNVDLVWESPAAPAPFDYPLAALPREKTDLQPYPTDLEDLIMSQLKINLETGPGFIESLMWFEMALKEQAAKLLSQRYLKEGAITCPYKLFADLAGLEKMICHHDREKRAIRGELLFTGKPALAFTVDQRGQLTLGKGLDDLLANPLTGCLLRAYILASVLHLSSGQAFPLLHQSEALAKVFGQQWSDLFPLTDLLANLTIDRGKAAAVSFKPSPEEIAVDRLTEKLGNIPPEKLSGPDEIGIKRAIFDLIAPETGPKPSTITVNLAEQPNLPLAKIIDKVLISYFSDQLRPKGAYRITFAFIADGKSHELEAVLNQAGLLTIENLDLKNTPFNLLEQLDQLALDLLNILKSSEYRDIFTGPELSARVRQQKIKNILKHLPSNPFIRQQIEKTFAETQAGDKYVFVETTGRDHFESEVFVDLGRDERGRIRLKPIFNQTEATPYKGRLVKFIPIPSFTRFLPPGQHASQEAKLYYIRDEIARASTDFGQNLKPDDVPTEVIHAYLSAILSPGEPQPVTANYPYFDFIIKNSQLEPDPKSQQQKNPIDRIMFIRGSSPKIASGLIMSDQVDQGTANIFLPERTFVRRHLMLWLHEYKEKLPQR